LVNVSLKCKPNTLNLKSLTPLRNASVRERCFTPSSHRVHSPR